MFMSASSQYYPKVASCMEWLKDGVALSAADHQAAAVAVKKPPMASRRAALPRLRVRLQLLRLLRLRIVIAFCERSQGIWGGHWLVSGSVRGDCVRKQEWRVVEGACLQALFGSDTS